MAIQIYVHRSEIHEACEVYKDRLTPEQIEQMKESDCNWFIEVVSSTESVIIPENEQ